MADVGENEVFTDPATALSQGKRHLLVRDYEMATSALSQACDLLAQKHGDLADELGEPYLLYGRALLGLAREEAGVLGGGVPGNEEAEEDDEDADEDDDEAGDDKPSNEDEKNDDTTKEPEEKSEKSTEKSTVESEETPQTSQSTSETTAEPKEVKQDTDTTESVKTNVNGEASHEKETDEENVGEEEEEEGQFSTNLQVAWEVLELSKLVLSKRGPSGSKLLAEAYRLLGEVAMETGDYKTALNDFQGCLNFLQKLEPIEARAVAEIHYQLGLAYSLGTEFDSSIEEFKKATVLLESRIKELQAMTEPPKTDDPFYTVEGEIQELRELLPEIQDKITDMKDFKQEAYKFIIEEIKSQRSSSCSNGAGPSGSGSVSGSGSGSGSGSSSSSSAVPQASKPTSDISHLVRKKRKPEDEMPPSSPAKKPTPEKKD